MRIAFIVVLCGAFDWASLRAQEPQPVELTIHGQAIESPVLKYRLLPAEADLKPGNAAPILLRLPWEQTKYINSDAYRTLGDWESKPLTAPEWASFPEVFKSRFFEEMKRAAFRREASWEYPIGEQPAAFILLPDAQGLRHLLGRGLSAKVRYHLSLGQHDQAREAILVGLANARHMAQTPLLVNQLVAAAIHRTMLDRTAELIAQPSSPNLYWPLSALPDSLLSLHRAADMESSILASTLPAANDLDRPRDTVEWNAMFDELCAVIELTARPDKGQAADPRLSQFVKWTQQQLRRSELVKWARQELGQLLHLPPEKVAAMSDAEAGVRWYVQGRINRDQRWAAIFGLPPREAWPRLTEQDAETKATRQKTQSPLENEIAWGPDYVSVWSVKRKIQALRIIEAVRHHLATKGELPEKLTDIEGLSIPFDPLTDQPFEWCIDGASATLKGPPLPAVAPASLRHSSRMTFLEYRLHAK
jgi:hypothetical protein